MNWTLAHLNITQNLVWVAAVVDMFSIKSGVFYPWYSNTSILQELLVLTEHSETGKIMCKYFFKYYAM